MKPSLRSTAADNPGQTPHFTKVKIGLGSLCHFVQSHTTDQNLKYQFGKLMIITAHFCWVFTGKQPALYKDNLN